MPYFFSSEIPTTNISVTNCISRVTAAYLQKDVKTTLTNQNSFQLFCLYFADSEVDDEYAENTGIENTGIILKKRFHHEAIAECIQNLKKE